MADTTARFQLPLIETGQAQKEITHNSALDRIDALLQLAVVSRNLMTPPANPTVGSCWLISSGAVGAWAAHVGEIAAAVAGGWLYVTPSEGSSAWISDEGIFAIFRSGVWDAEAWPVAALQINGRRILESPIDPIDDPAGGVVVDVEARVALQQILIGLRSLGLLNA